MTDTPAIETPPKKFLATQSIFINEIKTKFDETAVIHSTPFFCSQDPMSPSFIIEIVFGEERDHVAAYIEVSSGSVQMTRIKYFFHDHVDREISSKDTLTISALAIGHWRNAMTRETLTISALPKRIGFRNAMTREMLGRNCEHGLRVVVVVEYEAVAVAASSTPPMNSRLSSDFLKLLDDEDGKDVTFLVQGEEIRAHRNVLSARSAYFQAEFQSGMEESVSNQVKIPDIAPEVFRQLLKFLYAGIAPVFRDNVTAGLLGAADKYGCEDLKEVCETALAQNLRRDNVVDILIVADDHGCPVLQEKASAYMRSNLDFFASSGTDGLEKLASRPKLFAQLLTFGYEKL